MLTAMAHSNGWPCHLSAAELSKPKGGFSVRPEQRLEDDAQTLRVSNAQGQSVCMLTVIGGRKTTPGSRIYLQWDFSDDMEVPCVQVASCLLGEEWALYEDGSKTKAHSYIFDTCHAWVDPGITRRISESLFLSIDAPCVLCTDVVEISIQCQIDITVLENGKYNNLRIELPCHVVHRLNDPAEPVDPDEEALKMPLSELLDLAPDPDFPQNDIMPDLKTLSFGMEERVSKVQSKKQAETNK